MAREIDIRLTDITVMEVDCIVNAANEALLEGGGVCGAIFQAAGEEELTQACEAIGYCDIGKAVITPGFRLPARYIIHSPGPVWAGGGRNEEKFLHGCYIRSLELAMAYDCHTIAFPVISSGIYGYPREEAWRVALESCQEFLQLNPEYDIHITFAVLNPEMLKIGEDTLSNLS